MVAKLAPKNVILFSDLTGDEGDIGEVGKLSRFYREADIWLYVLGPRVVVPRLTSVEDVKIFSKSVEMVGANTPLFKRVKTIMHDGVIADSETGMHLFLYYKPQLKPPYPWYADFSIGIEIDLKVNVVKLISPAALPRYPGEGRESAPFNYVDQNTGAVVEDPVSGYSVQGEPVVLSAEKEKMITEQQRVNEEKSFDLAFFIDRSEFSPLYLEGGTVSAVVADVRSSPRWITPLDVFAQAMDEMNVVAFIKRVYNKGPQFSATPHVLFTCPEHGPSCLLLAKWPCEKDIPTTDAACPKRKLRPKTDDPAVKAAVNDYLKSLTVCSDDYPDDGRTLYALSEHLRQNPDTVNKIDFYVQCLAGNNFEPIETTIPEDDPMEVAGKGKSKKVKERKPGRIVPELLTHPILKERSGQYLGKINELCKRSSAADDPQQCATS